MSKQMVITSLEDLVPNTHIYRKFMNLWNFEGVRKYLKKIEKDNNYKGYRAYRLFKCLLLQFFEDLSDRELERYLIENNAGKWFCDFDLTEKTPDHTVFSKMRARIGTKLLSEIFADLRDQLRSQGYMNSNSRRMITEAIIAEKLVGKK